MPTDISDGKSCKLLHACKQSFHCVSLGGRIERCLEVTVTLHQAWVSRSSSSSSESSSRCSRQVFLVFGQRLSLRYFLVPHVQSVYVRFSPPTRPCIPWLVLRVTAAAATSTSRCGSRGWHIDTAVRSTPACSRSGSGTWAPDRLAGTRISGGRRNTNIIFFNFFFN